VCPVTGRTIARHLVEFAQLAGEPAGNKKDKRKPNQPQQIENNE
jgi:hypothetical protein